MTTYVIFENKAGNEAGLCPKDKIHQHDTDTEDLPMKVLKEFEAADWNAAMQVYNDFYGFGPYVPMAD
jgi:hypothetical protein